MGVRGLTTYIATNAERFLDPFELHDTDLVIDGDNLCIQLFVRSEERMGAFGGNYDHFARAIVEFFELLRKCNVKAYVLLDGGYEKSKLKTVRSRMLGRIQFVKHVKAGSNRLLIPLLMREVFVDALRMARIPFMRCLFEADNEIAVLARKLDCPVLSYDSDFYIHNVKYIPYVTVTHKLYRKVIENDQNYEIELVDRKNKRANRVLAKQGEGIIQETQVKESYNYLDCSLYTIENLIGSEQRLKPEMLPLFASLLGNDYIERRVLCSFYSTMKVGKVSRKVARHQRKIVAILKWLQHHSVKSATNAILNQAREKHRAELEKQLQGAMYGYNCEECSSFEYFGFELPPQTEDDGAKFREFLEEDDELPEDSFPEYTEVSLNADEEPDQEESQQTPEESEASSDEEPETSLPDNEKDLDSLEDHTFKWDPWIVEIYQSALTPRFVVDLYHSGLYINYPQVEDIAKPDSNDICYDVLRYIFALLKSTKHERSFRYLTRCEKVAQFRWLKFQDVELPEGIIFNTNKQKNISLFKIAFSEFPNYEQLFDALQLLPAYLQLYFLCIIFWAWKEHHVNAVHIHTLILCLIQLSIVDKRLTNKSRDYKVFQKNQKTYLETQKKLFKNPKLPTQESEPLSKRIFKKLSASVTKAEAILTYDLLLPHFSIHEKQQRKHAEFDRTTAHIFAELQAVVLNLLTLNALLRNPFEPVRIHELYNGLFMHNVYHTLKSRSDPLEYVRGTVFRYSDSMFQLHRALYGWVVQWVPDIETRRPIVKSKGKQASKSTGVSGKQQVPENDCFGGEQESDDSSDGGEFNDLNNQFSQLMSVS